MYTFIQSVNGTDTMGAHKLDCLQVGGSFSFPSQNNNNNNNNNTNGYSSQCGHNPSHSSHFHKKSPPKKQKYHRRIK